MDSQHKSTKHSSQTILIAVMAIIIVLLVASTAYYYQKYKQASRVHSTNSMMGLAPVPSGELRGNGRMMMQPMPIPTLSAQQTAEISAGPDKATTTKTFDINGGNFYFAPKTITVNKGDTVTIILHDDGGTHDFLIDAFAVKTARIRSGNTASVTFTADKTGSFQYYCSVGKHKQMGMWGTLIIQ